MGSARRAVRVRPVRALVQRVSRAEVRLDGEVTGSIGPGLCVLLGVGPEDDEAAAEKMAARLTALRIFEDEKGRMNEPLGDREVLCARQLAENRLEVGEFPGGAARLPVYFQSGASCHGPFLPARF